MSEAIRAIKNFLGSLRGYGECLGCGDSWYWKQPYLLYYKNGKGAFPYCYECHQNLSFEEKVDAIREMVIDWIDTVPLETREHVEIGFHLVKVIGAEATAALGAEAGGEGSG